MNHEENMNYRTFFAMIISSMLVMYVLTYVNSYELSHIRWSETRLYMVLMMGAAMAVIMLSFMRKMYKNTQVNLAIYIGSLLIFVTALFLVRSQITVGDTSWMSAMIPHHSIAILTSENAQIEDLRVQELANDIILAQRREIDEMNWLLEDISKNGIAVSQEEADARPVPEFGSEP
jgi:hypothetical protein